MRCNILLQMGENVIFVDTPQQKDTQESEQETVIAGKPEKTEMIVC